MKQSSRKIVAVMIVTAALCADRAIAAAPTLRPAVGEMASGFVIRLARSFGRTVSQVKLRQVRAINDRPQTQVTAQPITPVVVHATLTAFQFRLPPPLV